jgi:hypothetical protein
MRSWCKPIMIEQRDKDDGVVRHKSDMAFSTADRVFTHLKRVLSVSGSAIPDLILARFSRRSFSPHARECLSCSNTTDTRRLWRYPRGPIDKRKRQRLLSCSSLSAANHTCTTEFRLLVDFLPSLAKKLAHHYKTIAPLPYYTEPYLESRLNPLGIHAGRSIIDLSFSPEYAPQTPQLKSHRYRVSVQEQFTLRCVWWMIQGRLVHVERKCEE